MCVCVCVPQEAKAVHEQLADQAVRASEEKLNLNKELETAQKVWPQWGGRGLGTGGVATMWVGVVWGQKGLPLWGVGAVWGQGV